MYTVLFAIERVVLFKDVHDVTFYCDMDHCCNYTKKTYDTEIILLITGTWRLCGEHTKLCILHFCSAVDKKEILKTIKVQQGSSVSASVYVSGLATSFRDHELPIFFCYEGDLKTNTSVPRAMLWLLSFETSPSQACALLTPESGADAELPAGSWREREGDLPQQAGRGECRDEWMDGVEDRPCYAYTGQSCQ